MALSKLAPSEFRRIEAKLRRESPAAPAAETEAYEHVMSLDLALTSMEQVAERQGTIDTLHEQQSWKDLRDEHLEAFEAWKRVRA